MRRCSFSSSIVARRIEQLDVGQGDAALVWMGYQGLGKKSGIYGKLNRQDSLGMVDTGSLLALNEQSWIRLFAKRGIHRLDWVLLTHLDEDHAGGLRRLARLLPIRCVYSIELRPGKTDRGRNLRNELESLSVRVDSRAKNCIPFPVKSLTPARRGGAKRQRNHLMSGILVPLGEDHLYVNLGDADQIQEGKFLPWVLKEKEKQSRKVILKLSHHGSRYSSSVNFLKALRPIETWNSSGLGNRYGHPAWLTLTRLIGLGIPIRRTDESGILTLE